MAILGAGILNNYHISYKSQLDEPQRYKLSSINSRGTVSVPLCTINRTRGPPYLFEVLGSPCMAGGSQQQVLYFIFFSKGSGSKCTEEGALGCGVRV